MSPPKKRPPGNESGGASREPIATGTRIVDLRNGLEGEIVDDACQYAYPNAAPVFVYLIRWEDGQVQSITEHALDSRHDFELVDSRAD